MGTSTRAPSARTSTCSSSVMRNKHSKDVLSSTRFQRLEPPKPTGSLSLLFKISPPEVELPEGYIRTNPYNGSTGMRAMRVAATAAGTEFILDLVQ